MTHRIGVGVTLSGLSRLYGGDLRALLQTARIADTVGIELLNVTDHLVMGKRTDRYPYGRFPFASDEPWPEPLTTLAAMAGATERIRLGTGILIVPLRPPVLLAKTLATLDVLSGGRLDLGVGTGWQREEFEAAGVPWAGRAERMLDSLRACRALWTRAPASFRSPSVSFGDVWCLPQPVQPGGIPIHFGAALGPRTLAAIVELGAGWTPIVSSPDELVTGVRRLREAFAAAGRDPAALAIRTAAPIVAGAKGRPDLDATLAGLDALGEIGVTTATFALAAFARSPAEIRPFLERLGRRAH